MSVVTASIGADPGYKGLIRFADRAGLNVEPFQKRILKVMLGPEPEAVILLPRGAGKTTLMALAVVHHLLTVEDAKVYVAASSRDQARILYEAAETVRAPARRSPSSCSGTWSCAGAPIRTRRRVFTRFFRVLPAEGPRLHGLIPSLMIWDEAQAVTREDVYPALASALHKTPGAKLITVSTAGQGVESPLGQLRTRAMALPTVVTHGCADRGARPGSRDARVVGAGGREYRQRRRSRRRIQRPGSMWGAEIAADPAARARVPAVHREPVDRTSGPLAAAGCVAVVCRRSGVHRRRAGLDRRRRRRRAILERRRWVNESLQVGVEIFHGEAGVLECLDAVRGLGARYTVVEVVFDPWRFGQAAQELAREGVTVVEFPQHDGRMIPASQRLHSAITERRITLPDDRELARHAADTSLAIRGVAGGSTSRRRKRTSTGSSRCAWRSTGPRTSNPSRRFSDGSETVHRLRLAGRGPVAPPVVSVAY